MTATFTVTTSAGDVGVVVSDRTTGDFNLDHQTREDVIERCRRLVDLPWTLVAEEHGNGAVEVIRPGEGFGRSGDVIATSTASAVIGIWAGDCAPVGLIGDSGRIVVAHAGWRGIARGVIDAAFLVLGDAGAVTAVIGPAIGPCCYEFGVEDMEYVADGAGVAVDEIASTDHRGRTALDVGRTLQLALVRLGMDSDRIIVDGRCTGCSTELFSHRRRREKERHVMALWRYGGG